MLPEYLSFTVVTSQIGSLAVEGPVGIVIVWSRQDRRWHSNDYDTHVTTPPRGRRVWKGLCQLPQRVCAFSSASPRSTRIQPSPPFEPQNTISVHHFPLKLAFSGHLLPLVACIFGSSAIAIHCATARLPRHSCSASIKLFLRSTTNRPRRVSSRLAPDHPESAPSSSSIATFFRLLRGIHM